MKISAGVTVADALREIARRLAEAGIESGRLDARLLVEASSGMTRERMMLEPGRALTAGQAERLGKAVVRRLAHEPVSRILGERYFWGRRFVVTPGTLDPRPDTESLIELALKIVGEEGWKEKPIEILDVGVGTGCILLTLLAELRRARGTGIDISDAAMAVARQNADLLQLTDRVDWKVTGADELGGDATRFDLVVSNPPYIPSADIAGLDPEVRLYDPALALDGGPDGLEVVRSIVEASARAKMGPARGPDLASRPRSGTWFILELGAGQASAVVELIEKACGPRTARLHRTARDLGGHIRCVAWKPQI